TGTSPARPPPAAGNRISAGATPRAAGPGESRRVTNAATGLLLLRPGELPGLDDAALHHGEEARAVLQDGDVRQHVAVHHQHVGQLARLERAQLVAAAQDLGTRFGGAGEDVQRAQADVLDEEGQLLGVVAVRVPGEAVVAAHAEPSARPQDHAGTLGAA